MTLKVFTSVRKLSSFWFVILIVAVAAYYVRMLRGYTAPIIIPDEFGYTAIAAFLAGRDWSGVAQGLPWYNYGYSLLLAPFFSLLGPSHWYRIAQAVNLACLIAAACFANLWLRGLVRSRFNRYLVLAVVLLYPSLIFNAHFSWSESLIALLPWVLVVQLERLGKEGLRYIDVVAFGVMLAFCYYVHSRLIVLCFAGLIAVAYMIWVGGRKKAAAALLVSFFTAMILGGILKGYFIAHVYRGQVGGAQDSMEKIFILVIDRLKNPETLVVMLCAAAGQFAYLLISSIGLLIPGFYYAWCAFKRYHREREWGRAAGILFFVLALFGSYVLIVLVMGSAPAHPHHVFYGRYSDPLLIPLLALAMTGIVNGDVRIGWALCVSLASAFITLPLGLHLANSLKDQDIYWILIPSMFSYRAPGWQLNLHHVLLCFSAIYLSIAVLIYRAPRLAISAIGLLWLLASIEITQTFAAAPSEHSFNWRARVDRPNQGYSGLMLFQAKDSDPLYMRTQVQMLNPNAKVLPLLDGKAAQTSDIDSYLKIRSISHGVQQMRCSFDASRMKSELVNCDVLGADVFRVNASFRFDTSRKELSYRGAHINARAYTFLSTFPYARALWPSYGLDHVKLAYTIEARQSTVVVIKSFVTSPGLPNWLSEKGVKLHVAEGHSSGTLSVPVGMRAYDGSPLPKGRYILHAVVAYPDGSDWTTLIERPMTIR